SPDSFEADYDDVSLAEPEPPSKPGTVYSLAGSPSPSQPGPPPSCGAVAFPAGPEPKKRDWDRHSRGLGRAGAVLSVLLGLSILAGTLLLGLAMEKHREIMAELKLLKSNCSENQESVWRALGAAQQQRTRLRTWIQRHFQELQDVAGLLCRTLEGSRRCSAGWRMFGKSCYSFSWESLSWGDARDACADLGAHLVVVDSEGEQ
ncbi:C-type lectin domain family 17, member A-like, partial [Myiozetetes cayanensis]|uniref:C-type lectin domain family 17, member A-like n=1 Tax=Myiozetetes cayanensis TaxID=478635 RepID=UPI00215E0FFE